MRGGPKEEACARCVDLTDFRCHRIALHVVARVDWGCRFWVCMCLSLHVGNNFMSRGLMFPDVVLTFSVKLAPLFIFRNLPATGEP